MRMLMDRVLVVLEESVKEKGGIVIPERSEKANQWGRVAYVGDKCVDVEDGDRVLIGANSGTRLRRGGLSCVIIPEGEILCKEV